MAWIESHQSLLTHRKTGRLARALGIPKVTAIGHLHCFWWWSVDNAASGALIGIDAEDIADGALWEGDAAVFVSALVRAGFVDNVDGQLSIHDWDVYIGRLIQRRTSDAERKRNARRPADVLRTSSGHPADGRETAYVTVPNPTVPYPTVPRGLVDRGLGKDPEAGVSVAHEAPPPTQPEPAITSKRTRTPTRADRYGQFLDAVKALNPDVIVTGDRSRNAPAVQRCQEPPEVIAEAYVALWSGEWDDPFLRKRGSVHAVVDNLGGFLARQRGLSTGGARASPTSVRTSRKADTPGTSEFDAWDDTTREYLEPTWTASAKS